MTVVHKLISKFDFKSQIFHYLKLLDSIECQDTQAWQVLIAKFSENFDLQFRLVIQTVRVFSLVQRRDQNRFLV